MAFFVKIKHPNQVEPEYLKVFDTKVPSHLKALCLAPTPIRLSIFDALVPLADLILKFEAGELEEIK